MAIDYEKLVYNLMQLVPSIYAVAIVDRNYDVVYSTDNWDISEDINKVCSSWKTMIAPFITVSGVKYTMLELEVDTLVATSIRKEGHIVGVKDEERKIISYVEPEGDRRAAIVELSRVLRAMSSNTEANAHFDVSHIKRPAGYIDPKLKSEIEEFIRWIKNPNGFPGYCQYYLKQDNAKIISELSKIYHEFRWIFGV